MKFHKCNLEPTQQANWLVEAIKQIYKVRNLQPTISSSSTKPFSINMASAIEQSSTKNLIKFYNQLLTYGQPSFTSSAELLFENYGQKRRTCHSPKTDCWHPSNCPRLRKMSRRRGKDNTSATADTFNSKDT